MGQQGQGLASLVALVVDDHPIFRSLLAMRLGQIGVRVIEAEDGLAALDVVGRQRVDIVFMDFDMPVMHGWDCAKVLRASRYGGYILGVTSRVDEDRTRAALSAGMDAVSSKHIPKEVLASALLRAQRRSSQGMGSRKDCPTLARSDEVTPVPCLGRLS